MAFLNGPKEQGARGKVFDLLPKEVGGMVESLERFWDIQKL